jgi:hypothetical protein
MKNTTEILFYLLKKKHFFWIIPLTMFFVFSIGRRKPHVNNVILKQNKKRLKTETYEYVLFENPIKKEQTFNLRGHKTCV